MPPILVKHVTSFSSQDPKHNVENLVRGRGSWLSQAGDKTGRLQTDLQLAWATSITYIDVGNAGSVMMSVEVGRSSWPASRPLVTLLPATSLVSPEDFRSGKKRNAVRMFKQADMDVLTREEKWDRVRIICLQPFRKEGQFGLSLFRLHTNTESKSEQLNIVPEVVIETSKSVSNTDELVSKMNLPVFKKKTLSQRIGWLENRVVSNSEDVDTTTPSNPTTSPVSRAAKLLTLAAPVTTKEQTDSVKQDLEREALDYLISLNLGIDQIYSLRVIGIRQEFEKKRRKELDVTEKRVFKEIALDYAKRRVRVLEDKEEKKSVGQGAVQNGIIEPKTKPVQNKNNVRRSYIADFDNFEAAKTAMSSSKTPKGINPKERTAKASSSVPRGKFTFKHFSPSNTTPDQRQKWVKSPAGANSKRLKLRQDDDLLEPLSSSSRNNIALSDSNITPSKAKDVKQRKTKTPKKKTPPEEPNNMGVWITPKAKRKKENEPFTFSRLSGSEIITLEEDDGVDPIVLSDGDVETDHKISKSASNIDSRGGFLNDDLPFQVRSLEKAYNGINADKSSTPSSASGDSGYCRNGESSGKSGGADSGYSLNAAPVDKYGITSRKNEQNNTAYPTSRQEEDGGRGSNRADSDSDTTTLASRNQDNSIMIECPLCLGFFRSSEIECHAASCGNNSPVRPDSEEEVEVEMEEEARSVGERCECPICGKTVQKSSLESHATECAATMFD